MIIGLASPNVLPCRALLSRVSACFGPMGSSKCRFSLRVSVIWVCLTQYSSSCPAPLSGVEVLAGCLGSPIAAQPVCRFFQRRLPSTFRRIPFFLCEDLSYSRRVLNMEVGHSQRNYWQLAELCNVWERRPIPHFSLPKQSICKSPLVHVAH